MLAFVCIIRSFAGTYKQTAFICKETYSIKFIWVMLNLPKSCKLVHLWGFSKYIPTIFKKCHHYLPASTSQTFFVFSPCLQILWQKAFTIWNCKETWIFSLDGYNLKLQQIHTGEKPHAYKYFDKKRHEYVPMPPKFNYVLITIIIVTKFTVERLHEMYQCAYLYN